MWQRSSQALCEIRNVFLHTSILRGSVPVFPSTSSTQPLGLFIPGLQPWRHITSSRSGHASEFELTDDLKRQLRESVGQLDKLVAELNDTASLSSSKRRSLQRDVNRLQNTSTLISQYDHLDREVWLEMPLTIAAAQACAAFLCVGLQVEEYKALIVDEDDPELQVSAQKEIASLEDERKTVEKDLLLSLLPHDVVDDRDVMLEVRAAAGGQEATLFAQELFSMYQLFAGAIWSFMTMHSCLLTPLT